MASDVASLRLRLVVVGHGELELELEPEPGPGLVPELAALETAGAGIVADHPAVAVAFAIDAGVVEQLVLVVVAVAAAACAEFVVAASGGVVHLDLLVDLARQPFGMAASVVAAALAVVGYFHSGSPLAASRSDGQAAVDGPDAAADAAAVVVALG